MVTSNVCFEMMLICTDPGALLPGFTASKENTTPPPSLCLSRVYLKDQNTPGGSTGPITRGRTNLFTQHTLEWLCGICSGLLTNYIITQKIYLSQRLEKIKMPVWKRRDADIYTKN